MLTGARDMLPIEMKDDWLENVTSHDNWVRHRARERRHNSTRHKHAILVYTHSSAKVSLNPNAFKVEASM